MNLAIVSPYPPTITGISQYGYHISRALAQAGQFSQITVLTGAEPSGAPEALPAGVRLEYTWRPNQAGAGPAIVARLRALKPDLVWYNLGASIFGRSPLANLAGFMCLGLGQRRDIPSVVTLHELVQLSDLQALGVPGGRLARLGAALLTQAASQADVICLTLQRYVDWFKARHPNLPCLHVPIGAFYPPARLPETATPELLFFTTLAPFKGLDTLVEAYRRLLPSSPALRLTVAGSEHPRFPGYLESVRQAYADLPGITWRGEVPDAQVRDLFARAQLVVLPYRASTGASSVFLQAAAWGRPVVASDLLDMRAMARDCSLSLELFETGNVPQLANALQTLLQDAPRRQALVAHNFRAIQRMRPEDTCRLYLQAFNMALETRQRPQRLRIPSAYPLEYL